MYRAFRAVLALMTAVGLAVIGNGLIAIVLPLAANAAGWDALWIGSLGSAYFLGMLLGSLFSPVLIARVGHDRAFTAVIAMATMATLGFSVLPSPLTWILFRGAIGFAFAIFYATVESWLQGSSDNSMRGKVLAIYSVVQNLGSAIGNQGIALGTPGSSLLFEVAAIVIAASIIPVAVSSTAPPPKPKRPSLPFVLLWKTAPIGIVGTFLIGFANGPFWTLTPLFASGLHMSTVAIATFMTMLTLGGAMLQMPVGFLSDRFDRRRVLLGLLVATLLLELGLGLFGPMLPVLVVYAVGLALGGVIATQYYVVIAHVNDRTGKDNVVGIASLILFVYCAGAILGPLTAAKAMDLFGPTALMLHNVGVHVAFIGYVVWRMLRADPPLMRVDEPITLRSSTT